MKQLTHEIIGAAITVHRELGPGLLETIYEKCLVHELRLRGLAVETQKAQPITYRGVVLEGAYRLDLVVESKVVVELKCVDQIDPVQEAQLLSYLRFSGCPVGLLINFRVPVLARGIRRFVHNAPE